MICNKKIKSFLFLTPQHLPRNEEDYSNQERLLLSRQSKCAEEDKRLRSDKRVKEKHNKASREMVLFNKAVAEELKQKLLEYKMKYVAVSMPFANFTFRSLNSNGVQCKKVSLITSMLYVNFFCVLQIRENGDCIYNALLAPLHQEEEDEDLRFTAHDLKRQIGMYMVKRKEEVYPVLEPFLTTENISFRRYVYNTMQPNVWGDYGK